MSDRKVCIINKSTLAVQRVLLPVAYHLVQQKTHAYTTKGKLKSFINKQIKLHKNTRVVEPLDLKSKKSPHVVVNSDGRIYVFVHKKDVDMTLVNSQEIDHNTGKPKEITIRVPRYERRVAKF